MVKSMLKINALLLALFAVVMVGCNTNEDPVNPGTTPNPPTALMATSVNTTTVGLKWTAPSNPAATSYEVTATPTNGGTSVVKEFTTTSGSVNGLVANTEYTFTVKSLNGTAKSTTGAVIKWAGAARYTTNILLYETLSSNGSGLEFPDMANLKVSEGARWDICLDTRDQNTTPPTPSFDIGSPTKSSYTDDAGKFLNGGAQARTTLIGKVWPNVSSLDNVYESVDLGQAGALSEALINFNQADASGTPFAFVVKTASGNFAKVLVKASNGKLLQGSGTNRYVELEVSYQSGASLPYALKGNVVVAPFKRPVDGGFVETNFKKATN